MNDYLIPIVSFLLSLLFTACDVQAQTARVTASSAWLSVGADHMSDAAFGPMAVGLPDAVRTPTGFGFGGGVFLDRLYLGGFGDVAVGGFRSEGGLNSRTVSGSGGVSAGVAVVARDRVVLYPALGFGGGGARLRVSDRSAATGGIPPGTRLQAGYVSAHAALHLDWYPGPTRRRGGLMIGLSVIRNTAFAVSDWSVSDRSDTRTDPGVVAGLDALDPSGFGFRLRIGWGVNGFGR